MDWKGLENQRKGRRDNTNTKKKKKKKREKQKPTDIRAELGVSSDDPGSHLEQCREGHFAGEDQRAVVAARHVQDLPPEQEPNRAHVVAGAGGRDTDDQPSVRDEEGRIDGGGRREREERMESTCRKRRHKVRANMWWPRPTTVQRFIIGRPFSRPKTEIESHRQGEKGDNDMEIGGILLYCRREEASKKNTCTAPKAPP